MDRYEVYISDEELAEIDGEPLVSAPGKSVHESVLDQLQRYAQERGAAVQATVNEGPGAATFVLQVSPDGSSRVLVPEPTPAPGSETAPAPTSALAMVIARATAAARVTAPAPDPHLITGTLAAPAPAPAVTADLPAELAEPIGRINALAAVGRLDEASAEATALRESLSASAGVEHPHALEARALEAYIAHLRGDHREATVFALAVARIRCGTGDGRASAEVVRAAAAWQRLDDDRAALVHGRELLHMWDRLRLRGPLPPGHGELAEQIRVHVDSLETYV